MTPGSIAGPWRPWWFHPLALSWATRLHCLIMARLPRLYAPRIPQLVQARFARPLAAPDEATPAAALDRIQDWLAEAVLAAAVHTETRTPTPAQQQATPYPQAGPAPLALHAWAILPDAITLLATPGDPQILSQIIQALGRRMGSGMLRARVYAGRYHNALLEPGRWMLPAMLWVETQAVARGYVRQITQWPWSSALEHSGLAGRGSTEPGSTTPGSAGPGEWAGPGLSGLEHPALTDHPDYWQIGDTPFSRQAAWRQQLAAGIGQAQRMQIEAALHGQWALGEKIFLTHLARLASRRISPAPRGRPRKQAASELR